MEKKFILNSIIRENIKTLKPYSSARDEYKNTTSKKIIYLDANENPFENGVNRYPDPQQNSVKDILSKIKRVDKKNILLGNGSDEVLDLVIRAFCEPYKNNIITLPPTYSMYSVLAHINGVKNKTVLLSKNFQPQVDKIIKEIDSNSKILFLCSPNNPTGNSFSKEIVEELIIKFNGIVVIDEAYIDFSANKSWLEKLDKYSNLIIVQTLSKAFGMAGIRLGICYASEEIINVLNSIKPPYNVNKLTQQKAKERLLQKKEVYSEVLMVLKERDRVLEFLKLNKFIKNIFPTDSNFVLIKVDDATKRYNQLIKSGVVVRNRSHQPLCENCLRITIGTKEENSKLIKALKT